MTKSNEGNQLTNVLVVMGLFTLFIVFVYWIYYYNKETLSERCHRTNKTKRKVSVN